MDRLPEDDLYRYYYPLRVRYRDIDAQAIVFNGNYLSYIDAGVVEYWRMLGLDLATMREIGFDMAMVRSLQEFRSPACLDDVLRVYVKVVHLGNTSYTIRYQLRRDTEVQAVADVHPGVVTPPASPAGELIMVCENVYVNFDPQTRTARPLPPALREIVQRFEAL